MHGTRRLLDIALISAMGLLPLLWFKPGYNAIAGFDFAVYLNPVETLRKSLYLWSDLMAGGYDTSHEASSFAYYLLFALPVLVGAKFYTAEKIVFVSIFALQGFSIYYMLNALFAKKEWQRTAALSGVVFYLFSYPVMAHFGRGNMMALLTYGLLPLLIGLLYRGFTEPRMERKYILLITLLSLPIASTKGHPADFMVLLAVASFFTAFHAVTSGFGKGARILWFSIKAAAASAAVNLWWVAPNIMYMRDLGLSKKDLIKEGFYNVDLINYYSGGVSILNMFRNERLNLWFDTPSHPLLNPELYQSAVFVAIGLLIPIAAYFALFRRTNDRNIVFFAIISLAAVFLGKGTQAPFGKVYLWMAMHLPGFFLFRAPYRIFSSLLSFSTAPLAAFMVGALSCNLRRWTGERGAGSKGLTVTWPRLRIILTGIFLSVYFCASISYAWPLFTGAHLKENGSLREPGLFHNIPEGYYEAERWLKGEGEGFKLYYPYQVYDSNTTWGYNGPDPSYEILGAPKVVSRPGGTVYIRYQKPIEALNSVVWGFEYGDLRKILGVYNVRYALMHGDYNAWVLPDYNFNRYAETLFENNGIGLKKKAGPLMFYENKGFLPRIYRASKAYLLAGDESSFQALSLSGHLDAPFLVMLKDLEGEGDLEKALDRVSGVIFFDSNLADGICGLLEKGYGAELRDGKYMFEVKKTGSYDIFVKSESDIIYLNGNPIATGGHEDRGLRWKKAGTVGLGKGAHTVSVEDRGGGVVEVIPHEFFSRLKGLLEGKMKEDGFEVVYILGAGIKAGGKVTLPGNRDYAVSSMQPDRYGRRTMNLLDVKGTPGGDWRFVPVEGGGRYAPVSDGSFLIRPEWKGNGRIRLKIQRNLDAVDIGHYPELAYDYDRFMENRGRLKMELIFHITLDDGKPAQLKVGEDMQKEYRGTIDLKRLARERYGDSAAHRFKSMEMDIVVERSAGEKAGDGIILNAPALKGAFGMERLACGGIGGFSMGRRVYRADNGAGCGRWRVEDEGIKPGDYFLSPLKGSARGGLVMIRKTYALDGRASGMGGDGGTELEFKRLNPTKYVVRAGAQGPVNLVFGESYSRGWSFYMNGRRYEPVKVNGYANGFNIDEAGTSELTLEYRPQKVFDYARALSGFALAGIVFLGKRPASKK
ncbi:MAG: hypothetical protein AAB307_00500 [Deltaproteobacteria bacterium]